MKSLMDYIISNISIIFKIEKADLNHLKLNEIFHGGLLNQKKPRSVTLILMVNIVCINIFMSILIQ